jgi:hypothetical protein
MADIERSRAVTAAALIALVGSVGTAGFGLLMLVDAAAMNQPQVREEMARQAAAPPISPVAMVFVMSAMALAFAGWGCASGVAALRLKRWGRMSFIVFGGILTAFGAMEVLGSVLGMVLFMVMPLPNPDVPRSVFVVTMGIMLMVSLAFVGIGVWWLILFNRKDVKAQFTGGIESAPLQGPAIPMRILVIAWLMVAPVVGLPVFLAVRTPLPAFLFGVQLRGPLAVALLLIQFAVGVTAGVGLLRRRRGAHALAIGFYVYSLLNFMAMTMRPGGLRRVLESYQPPSGQAFVAQLLDSMTPLLVGISLVFTLALIALLISARGAYIRACTVPESAAG